MLINELGAPCGPPVGGHQNAEKGDKKKRSQFHDFQESQTHQMGSSGYGVESHVAWLTSASSPSHSRSPRRRIRVRDDGECSESSDGSEPGRKISRLLTRKSHRKPVESRMWEAMVVAPHGPYSYSGDSNTKMAVASGRKSRISTRSMSYHSATGVSTDTSAGLYNDPDHNKPSRSATVNPLPRRTTVYQSQSSHFKELFNPNEIESVQQVDERGKSGKLEGDYLKTLFYYL